MDPRTIQEGQVLKAESKDDSAQGPVLTIWQDERKVWHMWIESRRLLYNAKQWRHVSSGKVYTLSRA